MVNENEKLSIFSGIVVYCPDFDKLKNLINCIENQVDEVIIYNNGGFYDVDITNLFNDKCYKILGCGENVGIAKALNDICCYALDNKADYLLTFDQDSSPRHDYVNHMQDIMNSLVSDGLKVAAIGPSFVDGRGENQEMPIFRAGSFWVKKIYSDRISKEPIEASFLITSGMFLKVATIKKIGGFRDDFFIDHVDTEWCLRAVAKGFKFYVCPSVVMLHELSDDIPKRVFGRLVLKYSPIRRYYAFRNAIALAKTYHIPNGMRLYLIATICYRFFVNLLVDQHKLKSFKAMVVGMLHGITGKMGKNNI